MEKTINVNLGGRLFSLEEDAYARLSEYLDSIKRHYGAGEDAGEIVNDIEASIADKFAGELSGQKQVIILGDVADMIKHMGTVDEIASADEPAETGAASGPDKDDGGSEAIPRRLYRDPDNVVVAGVASGLSAYFGIDPVFFRLLFIILTFVNGIGLLAYVILWLIVPKAETSKEKFEMRGKPVNIAEIQQAVKDKSAVLGREGRAAIGRWRQSRAWYKIVNFPVKLIELVFGFIRRIGGAIFPALSVMAGLVILAACLAAVLGLTVGAGLMIFNLDSPYLVSDLPLRELGQRPSYYLAVGSAYAVALVPVVLLILFALTLIARKNAFRLAVVGLLAGLWMLAAAGAGVAAADLLPFVRERYNEIARAETVARTYNYKDFQKLYIGGNQKLKIRPGEGFAVKLSGRAQDLDRLAFNIEDGQLQITERGRAPSGLCLFCLEGEIEGEIIVPRLISYVGIGRSEAVISGFEDNLYVSLGESARAKIELAGQDVSGNLSGVSSRLTLAGGVDELDLKLDGHAGLAAEELTSGRMRLEMGVFSAAGLAGETDLLEADMSGWARLDGSALTARMARLKAGDFSRVEIHALDRLEAAAAGDARIYYLGEPAAIEKTEKDRGRVERQAGPVFSGRTGSGLMIEADIERYGPHMSAVRGIGLLPAGADERASGAILRWRTDWGELVEDWEDRRGMKEIETGDRAKKIYWTFPADGAGREAGEAVYVYLGLLDPADRGLLGEARLKLLFAGDGTVKVEHEY